MLRLFRAGLVAAGFQLLVVVLASFVVLLSARHESTNLGSLSAGITRELQSAPGFPLLTWVYLLSAIGVALTSRRVIDATAVHIRQASRAMRPTEPEYATRCLLVQLWLTAIGCSILAFQPPPICLIEVADDFFGSPSGAWIAWSGTMSIGTASFGANAQAANRAL